MHQREMESESVYQYDIVIMRLRGCCGLLRRIGGEGGFRR